MMAVAVRLYLRYGLSYRDVEGLLAERGVEFTPPNSGLARLRQSRASRAQP
jgi:hypothetical protein